MSRPAAGSRASRPPPRGHAIEARLNAEDPAATSRPRPAASRCCGCPPGPGVRVDSGIAEGDTVPPDFDSMIAKIIAHGRTRDEAIARLRRAIADTLVVIEDGTTNQGFLLELLDRPELRSGEVDTGWLDRLQGQGAVGSVRHADTALVQAAIALSAAATATDRAQFYALARRGRPHAEAASVPPSTSAIAARATASPSRRSAVALPRRRRGQRIEAEIERLGEHESRISYGGRSFRTVTALQDADLLIEVNGVPHRVSRDEGGLVRSQAPAVVVAIPVAAGDEVHAGDVVAVTESMKMEASLTSPVRGRVREVLVSTNVYVAGAAARADRPARGRGGEGEGERVASTPGRPRAADRARCSGSPGSCSATTSGGGRQAPARRPPGGAGRRRRRARAAELYADLRALSRPHAEEDGEALLLGSPQERLHAFLRTLDAKQEGLPERFVASLERALANYGVSGLERTSALEDAAYRIFVSQQRADAARAAVRALLTRHLERTGSSPAGPTSATAPCSTASRSRSRRATPRSPSSRASCAGSTSIRPLIRARRTRSTRTCAGISARWRTAARSASRTSQALVSCQQPLAPLMGRLAADATPAARGALVEAMTRRYFRIRPLEPMRHADLGGVPFALGTYEHEGVRYHVARRAGWSPTTCPPRCARSPATRARCRAASRSSPTSTPAGVEDLERLLGDADLPPAPSRASSSRR